jgi:cation diffusion facilitator family transporter
MRPRSPANRVVLVALASNLAIALTKFVAATITGSSAMVSEGIHSLADTINGLLLLYGLRRAAKPPDERHPFGHGRELYVWSFVVSLLVLALGSGASFYEAVTHMLHGEPKRSPLVNYAVLGAAFVFEGGSWLVTLREFRRSKGRQGWFEAFRSSKDPSTFTVLFEDSAALLGLAIAALGVAGSQVFGSPQVDAFASLGIGAVLAVSSLLLVRETKGLLVGESAHPHIRESILDIAAADRGVRSANGVITTQLGPHQIVAALSAEFEDDLTTTDIEECVNRVEKAIHAAHPDVMALFVKPQTKRTWLRRRERIRRAS